MKQTEACYCHKIPAKDRGYACCDPCLDAAMDRSAARLEAEEEADISRLRLMAHKAKPMALLLALTLFFAGCTPKDEGGVVALPDPAAPGVVVPEIVSPLPGVTILLLRDLGAL